MASMDYEMHTLDVQTAFLLSPIKEEIYIKIPSGYSNSKVTNPNMVLRLKKCLYGLKQAPMEWNNEMNSFLKSIGFLPTETDHCVYVKPSETNPSYILLYVDDLLLATSSQEEMAVLKKTIDGKFK